MIITILWALLFARLVYSGVGYIAPEVLRFGPIVVLISLPAVAIGAWIVAIVYDAWPESAKSAKGVFSPKAVAISTVIALPLLYLLWPVLAIYPPNLLLTALGFTLIPCVFSWIKHRFHAKSSL